MLPAAIITASLLLAHVTGAIAIVAPVIGNVGTIVSGLDKTVSGAINLRKIVEHQNRAKRPRHVARNHK